MGSGDNFYPYVHVDDAVDAIMKVAETPPGDSVINIVDDEPLRMRESAEMLLRAFGHKAKPLPVWLGKLFVGIPRFAGRSAPSSTNTDASPDDRTIPLVAPARIQLAHRVCNLDSGSLFREQHRPCFRREAIQPTPGCCGPERRGFPPVGCLRHRRHRGQVINGNP